MWWEKANLGQSMLAPNSTGLLNDFTNALGQQLYFWGCDVVHPSGNLLCEYGLERRKEEGVTGSSCYRTKYKDDIIELHGLCVGRYSKNQPSFIFTRKYRRCWVYEASKPPLPGHYDKDLIKTTSIHQIEIASRRFLEWWLEYESWIASRTSPIYRQKCYRAFRKLAKSKPWLQPDDAISWLQNYMDSPSTLQRAKKWKKCIEAAEEKA